MAKKTFDTKKIAKKIVAALKEKGIVVHQYTARTTNSVYLKFDYGVLNTLRISDHKNIDELSYKYNLLTINSGSQVRTEEGYIRKYYPMQCYRAVIEDIIEDRVNKMCHIGTTAYFAKMKEFNNERLRKPIGFWNGARQV